MIKLESGREVELKPLTFFQRAEIYDLYMEYVKRGVFVSYTVCGKAAMYALKIPEAKLDDYSNEEIIEIANKVFEDLQKFELDKKK